MDNSGGVSLADVLKNPAIYGLPTFEEYAKNPGRWRLAKDMWFQQISKGSNLFSNIKRHAYIVVNKDGRHIDCGRSLEKVEQTLKDEGIPMHLVRVRPELREDTSCKITHEVFFEDPRYDKTQNSPI